MADFLAPRETNELLAFEVTLDDEPQTVDVDYSIVDETTGARPATWTPAEVVNSKTHARIDGMAAGVYRLYARVAAGTETPVVDCGVFEIR